MVTDDLRRDFTLILEKGIKEAGHREMMRKQY